MSAQDTEAIRAALKWHGVEHEQRAAALEAFDRLVARLEAAERALERIAANAESWHGYLPPDNAPGAGHVRALGVIATWARAALAAAAPGETPLDVLACPECGKPLQLGHDCLAGSASAAPGETGQTP